ncbi:MAG: SpoIIE family protein phosphatase [Phycisphaeraceae bacterium]|nr:SpoIIE family protein phosphatase [Phycisphaeraceae bacterium]
MSKAISSRAADEGSISRSSQAVHIQVEGETTPRVVPFRSGMEIVVGRDASSTIRLAHDAVSRRHMRLFERHGRWFAEDLGSRHGTILDGLLLPPNRPVPAATTGTIVVRPFALRFNLGGMVQANAGRAAQAHDAPVSNSDDSRGAAASDPLNSEAPFTGSPIDSEEDLSSVVQRLDPARLEALNSRRLSLLLQAIEAIHSARDERGVAEAATEALITGTGFARAMFLKWTSDLDDLRTLSIRMAGDGTDAPSARVSRTLLRAVTDAAPVVLEDHATWREAESIVSSGVAAALCAPVVIPPLIEAYLYLDSQRRSARPNADAATFCHLVAKVCGLAIANLRRMAAEARQRELEEQLALARRAQQRLLPGDEGVARGCRWRLMTKPGLVVAGDIAGVIDHADGPTIFVGDVRGKGVDAAIVMSMIASHLAAAIEHGGALEEIMARLNGFVHRHRRDESDFASLFLARIDPSVRSWTCVDAGHGLVMRLRDGRAETIEAEGGPPLGISEKTHFGVSRFELLRGDRLVIYTDGVSEQCAADGGDMLGSRRIHEALAGSSSASEAVERMDRLLRGHAGGDVFADDVTILGIDLA